MSQPKQNVHPSMQEFVNNRLNEMLEYNYQAVINWIEDMDYIYKDEAYDYISENAEGRGDR